MSQASYLLAIASSITYGTADFLGGFSARRAPTLWVVVISQAAGLIFLGLLLPVLPRPAMEPRDYAWAIVAGITGGTGVALLYRALAIGTMSVVAPTTAVCAIAVPVVVGFALGERPGIAAIAGIGLAVVAIILVSQSGSAAASTRAVLIAIASGLLIGLFLVALERGGSQSGLLPLFVARIVSVSFFIIATYIGARTRRPAGGTLAIIITSGVIDMLANVLYVLAVRIGSLSIVATLTSLYPASTVVLARIILSERLRSIQWMGVVCAGAAIVLIVTAS